LGEKRSHGPSAPIYISFTVVGPGYDVEVKPSSVQINTWDLHISHVVTVSAFDDFILEDEAELHYIKHTVTCADTSFDLNIHNVYIAVWDKKPPPPMGPPVVTAATGGLISVAWNLHPPRQVLLSRFRTPSHLFFCMIAVLFSQL
jgi:hypothetical protein